MSLINVCKAVAAEIGISNIPQQIVGSNNALAVQMLALANRAGRAIAAFDWPALETQQTITTVAGQEGYALPGDFDRWISDTAWDRTTYWRLRGSLSPFEWQTYKNAITIPTTWRRFRLRGGLVLIFPTPTVSGEEIVFEYIPNTWVKSSDPTPTMRATFAEDSDTTCFPEHLLELSLKWRLLEAKGLPYQEAQAEFNRMEHIARSRATPAGRINMAVNSRSRLDLPNIPAQVPAP